MSLSLSHWVIFLDFLYKNWGNAPKLWRTAKNEGQVITQEHWIPNRVCTPELQTLTASSCPFHLTNFSVVIDLVTLTSVLSWQGNPTYLLCNLHLSWATPSSCNDFIFFKNPFSVLLEQATRLPLLLDSSQYYLLHLVVSYCLQTVNSLIADILSCFLWKIYIRCFPFLWVIGKYLWAFEVLKSLFI